uniref:YbbR-like domain-containing protein n=1 Tax=candidate division WOR-3 bacterium TaxID=2052148 RepID=A0A7C4UGN3_UNCW3
MISVKLRKNIGKFFSNLALFINSLIIGFSLWFYVVTGSIEKKILNIHIVPKVGKKLCILSYSPESLMINVECKKRQIILLSFVDAYINLNNDVGKYTITLDESNIKFPVFIGKINFFVMGNNEMNFEIDSLIEKKVKVVMIQGLGSEPDSVILLGPKRLIGNVSVVIPDSVPEKGKTTTITLGEKLIKVIPNTIKIEQ